MFLFLVKDGVLVSFCMRFLIWVAREGNGYEYYYVLMEIYTGFLLCLQLLLLLLILVERERRRSFDRIFGLFAFILKYRSPCKKKSHVADYDLLGYWLTYFY